VNLVQNIFIFAIRVYRWTLSPAQFFFFGGGCRFTPTCSQYTIEAIRSHGAIVGGWLAAKRICRCHPWGDCGHDPIPKIETRRRQTAGKIVLGNAN
jgi:putative membrane protein insertion efficiency factor